MSAWSKHFYCCDDAYPICGAAEEDEYGVDPCEDCLKYGRCPQCGEPWSEFWRKEEGE